MLDQGLFDEGLQLLEHMQREDEACIKMSGPWPDKFSYVLEHTIACSLRIYFASSHQSVDEGPDLVLLISLWIIHRPSPPENGV